MTTEVDLGAVEGYKSPVKKLVRFFEKSRDKWKQKYMERKNQCRKLSNQVRAVEGSRERWRNQAKAAEKEIKQLRQQVEELKNISR